MNDLNKIDFWKIKFDKNNGEKVVLGKGASSIVYSGKYSGLKVAIKKIDSVEFSDAILSELIFLKNVDNQYIIKYFGYSIDVKGNFYILTGNYYLTSKCRICKEW
jgi:predicted Ser/Thr protein kinase